MPPTRASFSRLPANLIRTHMFKHLNGTQLAMFAMANKEMRNVGQSEIKKRHNALTSFMDKKIDAGTQKLLRLIYTALGRRRRHPHEDIHIPGYTISPSIKCTLSLRGFLLQITFYEPQGRERPHRWTCLVRKDRSISGNTKGARVFTLREQSFNALHLRSPMRWFMRAITQRAKEQYNRHRAIA